MNGSQTSESLQLEDGYLGEEDETVEVTVGGRLLLEPRLLSSPCLSHGLMDSDNPEGWLQTHSEPEKESQGDEEKRKEENEEEKEPAPSPLSLSGRQLERQSTLGLNTTAVPTESLLDVMFLMQNTLQAILEVMTVNNSLGKMHKKQLQGITEELKQINCCMLILVRPTLEKREQETGIWDVYSKLVSKDTTKTIDSPSVNVLKQRMLVTTSSRGRRMRGYALYNLHYNITRSKRAKQSKLSKQGAARGRVRPGPRGPAAWSAGPGSGGATPRGVVHAEAGPECGDGLGWDSPQNTDAPAVVKARLQVRSARRLPTGSLGGQEKDLDPARKDLWPGRGADVPGRDLAAGEGRRRASRSISAPSEARRQHPQPR
ncbi:hypothetical protein NDU88_004060 [Pleurodeles waltl]|uniref:Uncharacterized protein n=1 Tax=Pleurodeles waltl TaxID=8319 RepID=A0AAV7LKL2_PLEWA|nr:hypothetical protein NDU88_004060 [Pleurodeles waltl]